MTVQILRNILDRHADGYTMYLTLYAWENLGIFIWLITKIHYFLSSNFPETDFKYATFILFISRTNRFSHC